MPGVFKTIPPEDQSITPFKVYKSWEYTGTINNKFSELTSQSIFLLTAIKPNPSNFSNGLMSLDYDLETATDLSADLLNSTYKFLPAGIVWYSLKHQYFNDYNGQINFGGHAKPRIKKADNLELWSGMTFKADVPSTIKSYNYIEHALNPSSSFELQDTATVISIPQNKFGEEIKPGSVEINFTDLIDYAPYTLTDDGLGNLIDTSLSPSFKLTNKILSLGFENTITSNPSYPVEIVSSNIIYQDSFILNNTEPLGKCIYLSESYVRIDGTPSYFNPRTLDNYAVSFWFTLDTITPGHGRNSHLVSKRSLARNYQLIDPSGRKKAGNIWRPNNNLTPYDIYVNRSGKLQAQVGDGSTLLTLSSMGTISTGSVNHVAFQKSGSVYQLYLNGTLQDTKTASLVSINNDADIFIGCKGLDIHDNNRPFASMVGRIDELHYYNTYLTSTEITQLSYNGDVNTSNIFNSNNVGKIFYKQGIIVISSNNNKYGNNSIADNLLFNSFLYRNSTSNYISNPVYEPGTVNIKWNSTLTLYENEILCRINEEEFNFTLNPSIAQDSENGQLPKEFIYNDEFGPYITTIGLYNENAELLAIGKLAGPIKKRSNVDLNIIVRFDQ